MIHNALQRFTELQRGAKVALGLDAGAGGLERMSETLQLTKDFWLQPEDAYLRGARLAAGGAYIAAGGAGNYSACGLSIQDEGWIATLREVHISTPTAGLIVMRRGLPFPTSAADKTHLDMRATGSTPTARVTTINNVAAVPGGTSFWFGYAAASTTLTVRLNAVLVSNGPVATETSILVYHNTANTVLAVSFRWEERRLLPGELYR